MINNISYLYSLKPKFYLLVYLLLISIVIVICSLFIFKSYDVYVSRGYASCDSSCVIKVNVDYLLTSKIKETRLLKINKENININKIYVSDILFDDNNKINYQVVTFEVDQLDDGILNTYVDVKMYSNYDVVANKIIKSF